MYNTVPSFDVTGDRREYKSLDILLGPSYPEDSLLQSRRVLRNSSKISNLQNSFPENRWHSWHLIFYTIWNVSRLTIVHPIFQEVLAGWVSASCFHFALQSLNGQVYRSQAQIVIAFWAATLMMQFCPEFWSGFCYHFKETNMAVQII